MPSQLRRRRPSMGVLLICLLLFNVQCSGAATSQQAAAPVPRPEARERPWLHVNDLFAFPMGIAEVPATAEQLDAAMKLGWQRSLTLPQTHPVLEIDVTQYPSLARMKVDLSEAIIHPTDEQTEWFREPERKPGVRIDQFELRGEPMRSRRSEIHVMMIASQVQLDLEEDRDGLPYLTLTDAKNGQMRLKITQADLERIFFTTARDAAAKHGVRVRSAELKVTALAENSLWIDLYVTTRLSIFPAAFRLSGRFDIDDQLNATFSNMTFSGEQFLGPIISRFIRRSVLKYEGRTRPLIGFPDDKVRLSDLKITVDDAIEITAAFGS